MSLGEILVPEDFCMGKCNLGNCPLEKSLFRELLNYGIVLWGTVCMGNVYCRGDVFAELLVEEMSIKKLSGHQIILC